MSIASYQSNDIDSSDDDGSISPAPSAPAQSLSKSVSFVSHSTGSTSEVPAVQPHESETDEASTLTYSISAASSIDGRSTVSAAPSSTSTAPSRTQSCVLPSEQPRNPEVDVQRAASHRTLHYMANQQYSSFNDGTTGTSMVDRKYSPQTRPGTTETQNITALNTAAAASHHSSLHRSNSIAGTSNADTESVLDLDFRTLANQLKDRSRSSLIASRSWMQDSEYGAASSPTTTAAAAAAAAATAPYSSLANLATSQKSGGGRSSCSAHVAATSEIKSDVVPTSQQSAYHPEAEQLIDKPSMLKSDRAYGNWLHEKTSYLDEIKEKYGCTGQLPMSNYDESESSSMDSWASTTTPVLPPDADLFSHAVTDPAIDIDALAQMIEMRRVAEAQQQAAQANAAAAIAFASMNVTSPPDAHTPVSRPQVSSVADSYRHAEAVRALNEHQRSHQQLNDSLVNELQRLENIVFHESNKAEELQAQLRNARQVAEAGGTVLSAEQERTRYFQDLVVRTQNLLERQSIALESLQRRALPIGNLQDECADADSIMSEWSHAYSMDGTFDSVDASDAEAPIYESDTVMSPRSISDSSYAQKSELKHIPSTYAQDISRQSSSRRYHKPGKYIRSHTGSRPVTPQTATSRKSGHVRRTRKPNRRHGHPPNSGRSNRSHRSNRSARSGRSLRSTRSMQSHRSMRSSHSPRCSPSRPLHHRSLHNMEEDAKPAPRTPPPSATTVDATASHSSPKAETMREPIILKPSTSTQRMNSDLQQLTTQHELLRQAMSNLAAKHDIQQHALLAMGREHSSLRRKLVDANSQLVRVGGKNRMADPGLLAAAKLSSLSALNASTLSTGITATRKSPAQSAYRS
jgi:hypothetical protein